MSICVGLNLPSPLPILQHRNWKHQKHLQSPLDSKEIDPVNPKGNQQWIFIARTDAEAEGSILWPPDMKSQLIGKDPDSGKDQRQEEERVAEDEMVGKHDWLNGHEFEQIPRDSEGQGILLFSSPWGHKEWDVIYWRATVKLLFISEPFLKLKVSVWLNISCFAMMVTLKS